MIQCPTTDLVQSGPVGRLPTEHTVDQTLARLGDVGRYNVVAVHDHGQRLAVIGLLERGRATDQHVEDDSKTPDVWKYQV